MLGDPVDSLVRSGRDVLHILDLAVAPRILVQVARMTELVALAVQDILLSVVSEVGCLL